jgi:hypothetical protein
MKVYASPTFTTSGQVGGQTSSVYYGYSCTVVTATGNIQIREGGASGQVIDVIAATTPAGTIELYSLGIQFDGVIYVEYTGGATGSVVIFYE